jgi:predicted DCC family thiol-disulfide oxidoreductase YuxK
VSTIDRHKPVAGSRPLLVYDGDCGFCVYSVRYWHKLTDDRVIYRPYQEVRSNTLQSQSPIFSARCNSSRMTDIAPVLPRPVF